MYCQVPCLSASAVFNQELRYVIERVSKLCSLNVTNLCFDCPLLHIECVLFSHTVSRKDLSKTFLTLVWILIERPYKWRHQFQVDDFTVFKARNLRTLHCLRCSEDQTQLGDVWSGMKVKILFCLLENGRFVLSWTLTFLCALLSPEVTCENAWSLCYVGLINVELEGQICNKGFLGCSQQDKRELRKLGSNRPILLMLM